MARGEKVGLLKVRLFRPFSTPDFCRRAAHSTRSIAVLDRTKEPGAVGDPFTSTFCSAQLKHAARHTVGEPRVIGGRYGLSSKEFTPAMVRAIFDELC